MRIAITGSNGLVGTALLAALKTRGHEVMRLVRKEGDLRADEVAWFPEAGLKQPEQLDGCEVIFHLAGRSIAAGRWTTAEKKLIRDSRVAATERLVDQLSQIHRPPSIWICASAVGIYGECGDGCVDETHPVGNDFLANVARDWEAASRKIMDLSTYSTKIRVVHARLGIVLDKQGGALAKMLPLFRIGLGGRLGNGHQYWSWIALADVIRAMCWMLETPSAQGAYNLVAPRSVTNGEFTQALATALHRPALFPAPRMALRLVMGEMADALLFTSCRAAPNRLIDEGFRFEHATLKDFLEGLFT